MLRANAKNPIYKDTSALEVKLSDPEIKAEFDRDLDAYEKQKREEALARAEKPESRKRLQAQQSSGFKMRMVMGYFWPLDVLKREGKPKPKKTTTINFNGKTLRGTILDSSHGTPVGVIAMESYDDKSAQKASYCLELLFFSQPPTHPTSLYYIYIVIVVYYIYYDICIYIYIMIYVYTVYIYIY